ncbi:MAG: hypothetical protein ABIO05_08380 [Ferruginibacter sp.]
MNVLSKTFLVILMTLFINYSSASDFKIKPTQSTSDITNKLTKPSAFNESCLNIALSQIEILVSYCYWEMLACGTSPECTIEYINSTNAGFAFIESQFDFCSGTYQG